LLLGVNSSDLLLLYSATIKNAKAVEKRREI